VDEETEADGNTMVVGIWEREGSREK